MKVLLLKSNPQGSPSEDVLGTIGQFWRQLLIASDHSYFLSWGWVKNWLLSLPPDVPLFLVVVFDDNRPYCAFFLGRQALARQKVIISRSLFLNSTGRQELDDLCVEFNGLLGRLPPDVSFFDVLNQIDLHWDEIEIPAMEASEFQRLVTAPRFLNIRIESQRPSFYVDLKRITDHPNGYLGLLSSNSRNQIKRSYRHYKEIGPLSLCLAKELTTAIDIFEELVILHQKTWNARGKKGAFGAPFFLEFHRNLIKDRFASGEIQLLKFTAGHQTIGCLYNFVYNQRVLFYQSGLNYTQDPQLKPGIVTHVLAIEHNGKIGNIEYHFLAGVSRYKRSLSNSSRQLLWLRFQKPRIRFRLESAFRAVKRLYRNQAPIRHGQ